MNPTATFINRYAVGLVHRGPSACRTHFAHHIPIARIELNTTKANRQPKTTAILARAKTQRSNKVKRECRRATIKRIEDKTQNGGVSVRTNIQPSGVEDHPSLEPPIANNAATPINQRAELPSRTLEIIRGEMGMFGELRIWVNDSWIENPEKRVARYSAVARRLFGKSSHGETPTELKIALALASASD